MASSTVAKDAVDEGEQRQAAQGIHDQFQWNESSEDEKDNDDNHEFFDARDTEFHSTSSSSAAATETNAEADLLHKRLNAQLSTNETPTKKTPGTLAFVSFQSTIVFFAEDPYFIDEEVLVEREALLTEEDKEVSAIRSSTLRSDRRSLRNATKNRKRRRTKVTTCSVAVNTIKLYRSTAMQFLFVR